MLGFIVPIKSQKVSKSWANMSLLFERTARSICNQEHPDFQMIAVCQEKPDITFEHPKFQYLVMNLDLPVPTSIVERRADKMRKLIAGIRLAKENGCSHIMITDADDCVSKFLAGWIAQNQSAAGYFFKRGYVHHEHSNLVRVMRKGFHRYCGTTHIIRSDLYDVSAENLARIPEVITSTNDIPSDLHDLYYCHRSFIKAIEAQGHSLQPLPFAGSVYILSNGENISYDHLATLKQKISLKSRLLRAKSYITDRRRLTPELREEFGLYDIDEFGQGNSLPQPKLAKSS